MARCKSCSAPLPANSNRCVYCSIRNDVDLHGRLDFSVHSQQSARLCPHCDDPLQTIDLKLNGAFNIERCVSCFGLFFDPGEIETLLESTVSGVFDINFKHLTNINKDRYQNNHTVKYVKCPECREMMRRVNFGHRSGVIIDRCRQHGVWLDSGEITHLMEWKKAGGQILNQKRNKREQRIKVKHSRPSNNIDSGNDQGFRNYDRYGSHADEDLVDVVSNVIFKLFN